MQGPKGPQFLITLASDPKKGAMCVIGFGMLPLIIVAVWCGVYWDMWADAMENNSDNPELPDGTLPYDSCGMVGVDTQWTTLLAFNSILYLIMAICIVCLMLSVFLAPCFFVGACGLCCSSCANFACIIVTGVFRYSDDGKACALATELANKLDDEYTDVGGRIAGLFISQIVLYCFLGCCIGALVQVSFMMMTLKKMAQGGMM